MWLWLNLGSTLDRLKWHMGFGLNNDADAIARLDLATLLDDTHDARLSNKCAIVVTI